MKDIHNVLVQSVSEFNKANEVMNFSSNFFTKNIPNSGYRVNRKIRFHWTCLRACLFSKKSRQTLRHLAPWWSNMTSWAHYSSPMRYCHYSVWKGWEHFFRHADGSRNVWWPKQCFIRSEKPHSGLILSYLCGMMEQL